MLLRCNHSCAPLMLPLMWKKHRDPARRGIDNSWSRNIHITCTHSAWEWQTRFYHTFTIGGFSRGLKETGITLEDDRKINACSLWLRRLTRGTHTQAHWWKSLINCLFLHSFNFFCRLWKASVVVSFILHCWCHSLQFPLWQRAA